MILNAKHQVSSHFRGKEHRLLFNRKNTFSPFISFVCNLKRLSRSNYSIAVCSKRVFESEWRSFSSVLQAFVSSLSFQLHVQLFRLHIKAAKQKTKSLLGGGDFERRQTEMKAASLFMGSCLKVAELEDEPVWIVKRLQVVTVSVRCHKYLNVNSFPRQNVSVDLKLVPALIGRVSRHYYSSKWIGNPHSSLSY